MLTRIIIENIGKISNADIVLDKPLNIFSGKIKQGKTTILNCIKWSCGGKFPTDILKHNSFNGMISLQFSDGDTIERRFFINGKGETKAKPVEYFSNGVAQDRPVDKLKAKFNPFQIDQNYFTDMNNIDKKRFLVDHFNVDTTNIDKELNDLKSKGKELRAQVDGYKPLQLEEVIPVDEKKLIQEKEAIEKSNNEIKENIEYNNQLASKKSELAEQEKELLAKLSAIEEEKAAIKAKSLKEINATKSTESIEEQIQEAKLTNYKADQYKKAVLEEGERAAEHQEKKQNLDRTLSEYKAKEKEKQNKLVEINSTHGIEGLEFIEGGDFNFEGTHSEMLSTSQNAKLSSLLQSCYPDSFAFEAIDQGESWGDSIYELIEKAKNENKTILVTKVDENPAKSTDEANVFVVDNGEVTLN